MADGLHVLGRTVTELLANYIEVLRRLEFCGLTLKPSKVEICPRSSILFGWKLEDGRWTPTEHTTSVLTKCEKPKTINQLRSFIGTFKQISQCVPQYASLTHALEQAYKRPSTVGEFTDFDNIVNAKLSSRG